MLMGLNSSVFLIFIHAVIETTYINNLDSIGFYYIMSFYPLVHVIKSTIISIQILR